MRNTTVRFLVGAGFCFGPANPSMRAARLHPRRDPEGHPNGGGGDNPPPAPAPGSVAGQGDPPAGDDWATVFEGQTPAQVKEALENSRRWENRSKENFDKAKQFDEIAKVLGGDAATPPDPAKLSADLAASQRETRETKVENAVLRAGGASGAALVDSRSFMATVSALDPAAADFEDQVKAAVTGRLQNTPAPQSASGTGVDPYIGHPGSLKTSSRDLGSAEADRRFGAPKT